MSSIFKYKNCSVSIQTSCTWNLKFTNLVIFWVNQRSWVRTLSTVLVMLVKVKCSRYRPSVARRVGRGIALLFHDHDTRRGWVVSSTPRPHFTPGKDPVPILQEAVWAPEPVWTGRKSRPLWDLIPGFNLIWAHSSVTIPTELPGPPIMLDWYKPKLNLPDSIYCKLTIQCVSLIYSEGRMHIRWKFYCDWIAERLLLHYLTDTDGLDLAQEISYWLLTVHVWVQAQAMPYEICCGHTGSMEGFPPSTSVSPSK